MTIFFGAVARFGIDTGAEAMWRSALDGYILQTGFSFCGEAIFGITQACVCLSPSSLGQLTGISSV